MAWDQNGRVSNYRRKQFEGQVSPKVFDFIETCLSGYLPQQGPTAEDQRWTSGGPAAVPWTRNGCESR